MIFARSTLAAVMPLLLEHHYLRRRTADPMFVFTWGEPAVACAVFTAPSNRYFGKGAVELSRLVRTPECIEPMTAFLRLCFTQLHVDPRRLKFMLSYADSGAGHHGGVYQAFNGIHVAVSKGHTLWYNPETKETVSNRSMDQRRPENRVGFIRRKTGKKYLYVWPIWEKRKALLKRFGWTALPYPKPSQESSDASGLHRS